MSAELPLLAVTGSQRPYIFDLPNLLSLPSGLEFRFRYRHCWVSDEIVQQLSSTSTKHFVGREMVVLFHSEDSGRLLPIRAGSILGIEIIGPMTYVRFRVGAFFKASLDLAQYSSSDNAGADAAATTLSKIGIAFLGNGADQLDLRKPLPKGRYLGCASTPVAATHLDTSDAAMAWARLAAVLQHESSLRGIPLFHLLGFRSESGKTIKPVSIQNRFSTDREEIHGYPLEKGRRYRMRVAEWCEPSGNVTNSPIRIHCEFNQALFALEGSSDLVVGRYDVLEFTFACEQNGYSEMALKSEVGAGSVSDPPPIGHPSTTGSEAPASLATSWPAIFVARVPVEVRGTWINVLWSALCAVGGGALYLLVAPDAPNETLRGALELSAIALLYAGGRHVVDALQRFFELNRGMRKLGGGPTAWGQSE